MSLHGELAGGAAQRRRERRLRSWLRHERQTVAMVLAEACHHSSGTFPPTLKERRMAGQDAYEALRGQKTARTAGLHPDELVEPGVQVRAVTVGYVAARVPTLAGHRLACDDDGVDGRTVRFLLKQSLAEKKKEWEEERRRMVQESVEQVRARVDAENAARHAASSSTGKRRKRKKRRKKRLPRTPRPRQGRRRPCDHQQQVPAVHVVRDSGGAPASVHRQSGHSCYACRDVYPQCELCSSSCAVPLPDIVDVGFGSSPYLDTKHTIYELCLPSERGCPDSAALRAARVFAPLCRVMVAVSLPMVRMILFGTVLCRLLENTSSIFSSTKRSLGCMLADIGSTATTRFALTSTSSRFKLMASVAVRSGSCICTVTRLSRWTVSAWMCCPGVCLASVLHPTRQRITPSMSCACLLSVR